MKKFKPCLSLFLALTMLCSVPSTTVSAVGSSRALNALAAEKTEQVVESVQVETAEGIRNDEIAEDELSAEESFKDEITEEETAHASTGDSSEAADAETAVESEIVVVGEDPEEANTEESEEAATEETAETVSEEQTKEVSIDVKAYALTGQQDGEDADAIAGEKSGEDSMDFLPDGIPVYSDAQDVTDYVRSKAIERMEEVIVCVPEEVFQQLIGMPVEYGFSEIFEHNGDPAAGDYLEHSLMSYYATARQLETGYSIVSYFFKFWSTLRKKEKAYVTMFV